MSEKVTFKKENTDVKGEKVIDFTTLQTESHMDDRETWNAMQPFGENDEAEMSYEPRVKLSREELQKILKEAKATRIGRRISALNVA